MKLLSVLSVFVVLFSCSEQEPEEDLLAINAKTEQNQDDFRCVIGPEIYSYITDDTLKELRRLESGYLDRMEQGDEGVIKDLERTQRKLSQFEDLEQHVLRIVVPKLPPRPKGCIMPDVKNGRFPLNSVKEGVVLNDDIKLQNIEILDENNNEVGGVSEIGEDSFGNRVLFFWSEFEGNATMYFTIKTEATGEMILELDVFKN